MTTPAETLRRFEAKLIPVRTVAGSNEALATYEREMLPEDLDPRGRTLIQQGFDAGFSAAMAQVRRILGEVQSETLRERQPEIDRELLREAIRNIPPPGGHDSIWAEYERLRAVRDG